MKNSVPSLLAQCNYAVAECNAVCTYGALPVAKTKFGVKAKVYDKYQEKEVEQQMTTYNEIEASRKYLNCRVQSAYYIKRDDIAKQFRIYASETPRTYKELIDAIKNDKFTIDTKRAAKVDAAFDAADDEDKVYLGYSMLDGIKFNIPTAPDRDGYNAATKELDKMMTAAKDVINTADATAGLKALQELEAWTPSTKAN